MSKKKRRPLLTTEQAADYLGVPASRILKMAKDGDIHYYHADDLKVRGHRFDPLVLDAWLEAQVIRARDILALDARRKKKRAK